MKLVAVTLLELFNIVGFGIEKKETNGKGSIVKYFQFLKVDLAWKILKIIPMEESENRASLTQKHGKRRFVVINTKKINIFSNINHCHKTTYLTVLLFQIKICLEILCPKRPQVPSDCQCHLQIPLVEWFIRLMAPTLSRHRNKKT